MSEVATARCSADDGDDALPVLPLAKRRMIVVGDVARCMVRWFASSQSGLQLKML